MRGEETQILGGLEVEQTPALVIAPGTHSKWVRVEGGRLMGFRTYMTGEVFALLKAHSILGRTMDASAPHDAAAFDLGVHRALEDQGLLNLIFSTRTEVLFEHIEPSRRSLIPVRHPDRRRGGRSLGAGAGRGVSADLPDWRTRPRQPLRARAGACGLRTGPEHGR